MLRPRISGKQTQTSTGNNLKFTLFTIFKILEISHFEMFKICWYAIKYSVSDTSITYFISFVPLNPKYLNFCEFFHNCYEQTRTF